MNWNLIGHEWAVQMLQHHLRSERVRHAYLLTGPQGVGRRTLALRFAQALTCPQPVAPAEPCGSCVSCQRWASMQHPDLSLVASAKAGSPIRVQQIRDMQRTLALAPYQADYRIALLLRFEEAHPAAANALLKTLEEPPPHVILVLTAESPEQLLPTITSRCEVMRLRPLPIPQVVEGLQRLYGIPEETARLLAHLSAGRPGLALRWHRQPEWLQARRQWIAQGLRLLAAPLVDRFNAAEQLARDPTTLRDILLTWLSLWRDALILAGNSNAPLVNIDQYAALTHLAGQLGWSVIQDMLSRHEQALQHLSQHANPRLTLENLLLHLPQTVVLPPEPA